MIRQPALLVLLISLMLVGCSTPARMYSGAELQKSQVATLWLPKAYLVSVDGRSAPQATTQVELLPGQTALKVQAVASGAGMTTRRVYEFTVNLEPGRTYYIFENDEANAMRVRDVGPDFHIPPVPLLGSEDYTAYVAAAKKQGKPVAVR